MHISRKEKSQLPIVENWLEIQKLPVMIRIVIQREYRICTLGNPVQSAYRNRDVIERLNGGFPVGIRFPAFPAVIRLITGARSQRMGFHKEASQRMVSGSRRNTVTPAMNGVERNRG